MGSLADKYPELRAEWSPKNSTSFDSVNYGSDRKYLWVCKNNHERLASPNSRTNMGSKCRECRKALKLLSVCAPELEKEWHPLNLIPFAEATSGSHYEVLWRCQNGHEWRARAATRVYLGQGCVECKGKSRKTLTDKGKGSLATRFPELFSQWDDSKELWDTLGYSSVKNAWWKCKLGHRWRARVSHRTITGSGCPECSGRRGGDSDFLWKKFPELEKYWSPKNSVPFRKISSKGNIIGIWVCENGHETNKRFRADGRIFRCKKCAPIAPDLLLEWSPSNAIDPNTLTSGSGVIVGWKCTKCDWEWLSTVSNRTNGSGCPRCAGKIVTEDTSLANKAPELERFWSPRNGLEFKDVSFGTKKTYWWVCEKNHESLLSVERMRDRDRKCFLCERSLASKAPWLRGQWSSRNADSFESISYGSSESRWWVCEKGHEWQAKVSDRTINGSGCPSCCNIHTTPEKILEAILGVDRFNRGCGVKTSKGYSYRPDVQVSNTVFVNADGLYWHSEEKKGKTYHFKMREAFEAKGLRLLQFWDDEVRFKPEIVKSMVDAVRGMSGTRIGARKCGFVSLSKREVNDFLAKNHIIGPVNFSSALALAFSGSPVQVLCYRRHGSSLEISRVATALDTIVSGGLGRLVSEMVRSNPDATDIFTYCDLRYADGHSLVALGFERVSVSLDFQYSKGQDRKDKRLFRVKAGEPDIALAQGYWKVYGAGIAKYIKHLR